MSRILPENTSHVAIDPGDIAGPTLGTAPIKGRAFIFAGTFDIKILPDDSVRRMLALSFADVARAPWADPSQASQRIGQKGDLWC